jgi:negative regulator of sigma-B (phosphoserine phosphatase)
MKLSASHLTRPKVGEAMNGDAVVVRHHDGRFLIAVVDALGHGPVAAEVAQKACHHLESVSLDLDVKAIIQGLHGHLRGTRGAAAMVCCVRDGVFEGCGVGNVDLRVQGGALPVLLSPGVLGANVRTFRVFRGEARAGHRLVLFSDGISGRFSLDRLRLLPPADACQQLVAQHSYAHDDATVLIADITI